MRLELGAELGHVFAGVAVVGRLGPAHPSCDRSRKALDLPAGVVDVVLALDVGACALENPSEGVANGCLTTVPDVQWAGRVR